MVCDIRLGLCLRMMKRNIQVPIPTQYHSNISQMPPFDLHESSGFDTDLSQISLFDIIIFR